MRAAESAAPEAPALACLGPLVRLPLWTEVKRRFETVQAPGTPSALPRRSCRHPVCGRVSRPRRGGGAYNTELVAAEGKAPERRGAPRPAGRPAKTF